MAVGTQIQPAGNKTMAPPQVNWGASGLHPEPDDACNVVRGGTAGAVDVAEE